MATLESPIVALLVSIVFTGVIQSSAATIGIVQALALSGGITWEMAIPLVLGANIGTCVTALISAIGTNKNAKRVVVMHFSVNVFGSVLCMIIMYVMRAFGVGILGSEIAMVGVAIIHTLFNAINTVALLPIKKLIIKFCVWVVKDREEKTHTVFLDERIFNNSPLAISECHRLANEMAEYAFNRARLATAPMALPFSIPNTQTQILGSGVVATAPLVALAYSYAVLEFEGNSTHSGNKIVVACGDYSMTITLDSEGTAQFSLLAFILGIYSYHFVL